MKSFSEAYNKIISFFEEQRQTDAPLFGNSTLRSTIASFTEALRTQVSTNGTYNRLSIAGLSLNRFGQLDLTEATFTTALSSKPNEIEALFGQSGVGQAFVSATDNATRFGTGTISTQLTSIDENVRRLKTRADDASARLALRRRALVEQYTRMEQALSLLNAQSSFLTSQMKMLQGNS